MEHSNRFKHVLASLAFLLTMIPGVAQVGFNNPNPAPSSLIDMTANDKGLLVPRMTTIDRTNMVAKKPAHALLVFDVDQNMFFVYDTISNPDRWVALNPFQSTGANGNITATSTGNVGIGTNTPTSKLEVNGTVTAQNYSLNATGNGPVPKGGIIMWSGNPNAIPVGWALCDGSTVAGTKTPNLSGRFIAGYDKNDADYNLQTDSIGPKYTDADGASNGKNTQDAKQIKLTGAQSGVAAHSHGINDPGHSHAYTDSYVPESGTNYGGGKSRPLDWNANYNKTTNVNTTGISIQSTSAQNASTVFENRPPFYVLAYIIKL